MSIDTDLFIVVGILLAALALPSAMGAYVEGLFPTAALIFIGIGAALVIIAVLTAAGGYSPARIPRSFIEILARIFN